MHTMLKTYYIHIYDVYNGLKISHCQINHPHKWISNWAQKISTTAIKTFTLFFFQKNFWLRITAIACCNLVWSCYWNYVLILAKKRSWIELKGEVWFGNFKSKVIDLWSSFKAFSKLMTSFWTKKMDSFLRKRTFI